MGLSMVFVVIIPALVVIAYELYDHEHESKIEKLLEAFKEFKEAADDFNKTLEDLDN